MFPCPWPSGTDEMEDKKSWLLARLCSMSCRTLRLCPLSCRISRTSDGICQSDRQCQQTAPCPYRKDGFCGSLPLHQRIFVAVFPLDGLFGSAADLLRNAYSLLMSLNTTNRYLSGWMPSFIFFSFGWAKIQKRMKTAQHQDTKI